MLMYLWNGPSLASGRWMDLVIACLSTWAALFPIRED
jgi:hypothetical protein